MANEANEPGIKYHYTSLEDYPPAVRPAEEKYTYHHGQAPAMPEAGLHQPADEHRIIFEREQL